MIPEESDRPFGSGMYRITEQLEVIHIRIQKSFLGVHAVKLRVYKANSEFIMDKGSTLQYAR